MRSRDGTWTEEFQEAYDFSGKVMPAQNVTVYAKWAAPEVDATVYLTMAGDGEPRGSGNPLWHEN